MTFQVYKSSAGSGKTYTLVRQFLSIALNSNNPYAYKEILAVTFTNKAVKEMKERILSTLRKLANNATRQDPMVNDLINELGISPEELSRRAQDTLTHMIHNYSDLSISTIDKFIHKVVRSFALDLGLSLNFDVELDADILLKDAIGLLMSRAGKDAETTKLLLEFVKHRFQEEKSWNIDLELLKYAKSLLAELTAVQLDQLANCQNKRYIQIHDQLKEEIDAFYKQLKVEVDAFYTVINENELDVGELAGGMRGIGAYFKKLNAQSGKLLFPSNSVIKFFADQKLYSAKADAISKRIISGCTREFTRIFDSIQQLLDREYPKILAYEAIYKNILGVGLLSSIQREINNIKKERNVVHISEFNKRVQQIVINEPVPFIYERLGARYKHFLVDEFQDTSVLQWTNLLPLVENALSHGHDNLVVGDAKQAIYRWRGGEVEQFLKLPKIYQSDSPWTQEQEQTLIYNFEENSLSHNYRSKEIIVGFNNWLFDKLSADLNDDFKNVYENLSQIPVPEITGDGGYVEICLTKEHDEISYEEQNLNYIIQTIDNCVNAGYNYGEIAVLCRKNRDASIISDFLLSKGIGVMSSESLLLKNNPFIHLLVSCLKVIQNPAENKFKLVIINYLKKFKNKELDIKENQELLQELDLEQIFKFFGIKFKLNYLNELSLYETVKYLVACLSSKAVESDVFLVAFLDLVHSFEIKNGAHLSEFIQNWELKKDKLSAQMDQDDMRVSIYTIHKSKGLEFPIVIFPFADWELDKVNQNMWMNIRELGIPDLYTTLITKSKKLEHSALAKIYQNEMHKTLLDNLNLFYVAVTRPKDRLYLYMPYKSSTHKFASKVLPTLFSHENWNEKEQTLKLGEETIFFKGAPDSNNKFSIKKLSYNDWRKKLKIASQDEELVYAEILSDQDYGRLVHDILTEVYILEDIDQVFEDYLERYPESEVLLENLKTRLLGILQDDSLIQYFSSGAYAILNERDIVTKWGKLLRPDRMIIDEKNNWVTIIDYKTGAIKAEDELQIQEYSDTLIDMGFEINELLLVYIEESQIIEIDPSYA
ncbi:MAG: UvrD-helicase domain-containing protein [Flavobacteriales bacterium]|nr:UvrD-helicase domain-containing protein [Flavobacteriales bacterium]